MTEHQKGDKVCDPASPIKLVLVNSTGPMGSSVISAIVEKFGYLNIPVRNLGLEEYLGGEPDATPELLKDRFSSIPGSTGAKVAVGGVSIVDRDTSDPRSLVDKTMLEREFQCVRDKEFASIAQLYDELRRIFAVAITYKKSCHVSGKHVELTTAFHKYDPDAIYRSYQSAFGDVTLIHMHRDFLGWIESLASQRFASPRKRFVFVFRWERQRFLEYERKTKACPGLHLDFEFLFIPHTRETMRRISEEISEPLPDIAWESESYDLYGNLKNYHAAFTKADTRGRYLSRATLAVMNYFSDQEKIRRWHDIVVYAFYFADMLRYLYGKHRAV